MIYIDIKSIHVYFIQDFKYESWFVLTRFLPGKVQKRGSVIWRLREGRRSSHSYFPQKVRPEDGGANWNIQVETLDLAPKENRRGIILVPLQTIREPSAVKKQTHSEESDLGPGNTETEASKSTKNSRSESISCRSSREILRSSGICSGSGSGTGSELNLEKPAGWKGSSTCQTAIFLTPNRVFYSSVLYLYASSDTNRSLEKMKNGRTELEFGWRSLSKRSRMGSGRNSVDLNILELSS